MTSIAMHDGRVVLHHGDCLEAMAAMEENSVDAVVCDPPYHLTSIVKRFGGDMPPRTEATVGKHAFGRHATGFMGRTWDGGDIAFQPETWAAVLRVLKPGGYIVAFASTRGFGRMSVAMEDAGFITHPMLAWIFGSGFPKATRIAAEGYDGFRYGGQALKPALEPIYMGQKPFSEKTGTANIRKWGTGAVNIDGCRVAYDMSDTNPATNPLHRKLAGYANGNAADTGSSSFSLKDGSGERNPNELGRWPANIIHDGSDEVLAAFPDAPGQMAKAAEGAGRRKDQNVYGTMTRGSNGAAPRIELDKSAARFFYAAKASRADRDAGLEHLPKKAGGMVSNTSGQHITRRDEGYEPEPRANTHPTVKPVSLCQWLCRLVTPPGGTILDPFMGSGSTGKGAILEGFKFIGIEREDEYMPIAEARIKWAINEANKPTKATTTNTRVPANDNVGIDLFSFGGGHAATGEAA